MKFDFQIDNNEDLEYFKTLFFRNVGIEQITYNFYMGDIMVRAQISSQNDAQLVALGFFEYSKEGKSVSLTQFNPLSDSRFWQFEPIIALWSEDPFKGWAYFDYKAEQVEDAFVTIQQILRIVYKINNLKAFL